MVDTQRNEVSALMECIHRTALRNASNNNANTTSSSSSSSSSSISNNNETNSDNMDSILSNCADYTAYNAFLQALEDGAKDLEITFEGVAEYLETTNVGLHLSLKKMKEKVYNDKLSATSAATPSADAGPGASDNPLPDLTYSKESQSVTSNSINFYEEACVDLTNWLITVALQYAALPSAAQLVSQRLASFPQYHPSINAKDYASKNGRNNTTKSIGKGSVETGRVEKVNLDGILYFHAQAEDRALQAIDSNLHAR